MGLSLEKVVYPTMIVIQLVENDGQGGIILGEVPITNEDIDKIRGRQPIVSYPKYTGQ